MSGRLEPEVAAVMNWTLSNKFVTSVALQGGALVATYPLNKHTTGVVTILCLIFGVFVFRGPSAVTTCVCVCASQMVLLPDPTPTPPYFRFWQLCKFPVSEVGVVKPRGFQASPCCCCCFCHFATKPDDSSKHHSYALVCCDRKRLGDQLYENPMGTQ